MENFVQTAKDALLVPQDLSACVIQMQYAWEASVFVKYMFIEHADKHMEAVDMLVREFSEIRKDNTSWMK